MTFERGWNELREDDMGLLWEHLVLDALRMRFAEEDVLYWQDKSRREIDFVVRRAAGRVDAVECKLNPDKLNPASVRAFRSHYPDGENHIASPFVSEPYRIRRGDLVFTVRSAMDLA